MPKIVFDEDTAVGASASESEYASAEEALQDSRDAHQEGRAATESDDDALPEAISLADARSKAEISSKKLDSFTKTKRQEEKRRRKVIDERNKAQRSKISRMKVAAAGLVHEDNAEEVGFEDDDLPESVLQALAKADAKQRIAKKAAKHTRLDQDDDAIGTDGKDLPRRKQPKYQYMKDGINVVAINGPPSLPAKPAKHIRKHERRHFFGTRIKRTEVGRSMSKCGKRKTQTNNCLFTSTPVKAMYARHYLLAGVSLTIVFLVSFVVFDLLPQAGAPPPPPPDMPEADDANGNLEIAAIRTQLAITLSIGILSILAFSIMRRRKARKARRTGAAPSSTDVLAPMTLPDTLLGWAPPLYLYTQKELIANLGTDGAVFILFLRECAHMFTRLALFGIFVLLPVHFFAASFHNNDVHDRPDLPPKKPSLPNDKPPLTMSSVPDGSKFLYVHLFAIYLVSYIVCTRMRHFYKKYAEIRGEFMLRDQTPLAAHSILVTGIPKGFRTNEALRERFEKLGIGRVSRAAVVQDVPGELLDLLSNRMECLEELEQECVEWEKRRVKALASAGHLSRDTAATQPLLSTSTDPTRYENAWSWRKFKHVQGDQVGILAGKLQQLDAQIQLMRDQVSPTAEGTATGFVTFENLSSANVAAQTVNSIDPLEFEVKPGPDPCDLCWDNLPVHIPNQFFRRSVINGGTITIVLFWAVPLALVSMLTNIRYWANHFPFFKSLLDYSPWASSIIQGLLPTLAVSLLVCLVPNLFHEFSRMQGIRTWSGIEKSTLSKIFFFEFCNVVLLYTVAGAAFVVIIRILDEPDAIFLILGESLPKMSTFFINYALLQTFIGLPLNQLIMIGPAALTFVMGYLVRTPREKANLRALSYPHYGYLYTTTTGITTIALTFAVISPLILPIAVVFFWLAAGIFTYQLGILVHRRYESGGRHWPEVFRCLIWALVLFQFGTAGVLELKGCQFASILVIPAIILTIVYWAALDHLYEPRAEHVPLDEIFSSYIQADRISPANDGIESRDHDLQDFRRCPSFSKGVVQHKLYVAGEQPGCTQVDGVLDEEPVDYSHPALTGKLPTPWLPPSLEIEFGKIYPCNAADAASNHV